MCFFYTVFKVLVGLSGLEPLTSRLSGVRSNRLSYRPMRKALYPRLTHSVKRSNSCSRDCLAGGDEENRTPDPLLARQVLSHLSYAPNEGAPSKPNNTTYHFFLLLLILRKEVIQPHLPIRLPCYDFTPVIAPTLGGYADFGCERLPWCDGRCVQGPGTYSPQYADLRLLAIPTSCRRVAACNPNWDMVFEFRSKSLLRCPLSIPL